MKSYEIRVFKCFKKKSWLWFKHTRLVQPTLEGVSLFSVWEYGIGTKIMVKVLLQMGQITKL